MNRKGLCVAMVGLLIGSSAYAQRRGAARAGAGPGEPRAIGGGPGAGIQRPEGGDKPETATVVPVPVSEASAMMQRQRVWLFVPPAGSGAYGLGALGQGRRVWALLPSCRLRHPDDPRDPCPIGRVSIDVVTGTGRVAATFPQIIGRGPAGRRVQSFVIPSTAQQVRVQLLRPNGQVRYEVLVNTSDLGNLPTPEGQPRGPGAFAFTLARYPSL